MKKIYNKILIVGSFLLGLGFSSCDDYLTVLPSDKILEDDFWQDQNDLEQVRAAAYWKLTGLTANILQWGEIRSDNLRLNQMTQQNLSYLQQGILMPTNSMFDWAGFYQGINYCNRVLEHGDAMTIPGQEVDPSFRESNWRPIKAEMLALRALYYFYLVRAYRNVPYVTTSVTTDEEAMNSRIAATPGVIILGDLINQLEESNDGAAKYAAENFGSSSDNRGRFTKRGVHALLADLYLWRGCMLKNADKKGDIITNENGDTLKTADLDVMAKDCFNKSIEHCDYVLNVINKDYQDDLLESNITEDPNKDKPYPYLTRLQTKGLTGVTDVIYSTIWGNRNSSESVLELQYDGVNVTNSTLTSYLSSYSNNNLNSGYMVGNSIMTSSATTSYDPARGFGLTDLRLLETFKYTASSATQPTVHKNVLQSLVVENIRDLSEGASSTSYRTTMNANWPIYRLTDIMLIKAEAIARVNLGTNTATATATNAVNEGFRLCNAIFERNNPALEPSEIGDVANTAATPYVSDRLNENYAYKKNNEKTAADLLVLVYQERQREFVGEGKRWFDITRQVEASNDPASVLSDYITVSTSVKNRLKQFYAFYNPIYSEEIKVNGVEYGGKLVQNPVWDRYTTK